MAEQGASSLKGARVALLEARMSDELAALVRRHGGEPYSVPAVREAALDNPGEVRAFLDELSAGRFAVVVLLTGVGASTLLREAERLGRLDETVAALRRTVTACRGPKPSAVLKRHGVPIGITPVEPYTTKELLEALDPVDLRGKHVALLHYGERSAAIADSSDA
jgi:uroporphyrinogen-III synthase